jgi:hypothetical protein
MASFNKFNNFVDGLAKGIVLNTDTLKVMLTNTAPVATNTQYSDISGNELANGNGYTTGGSTIASTSATNTTGTESIAGTAVTFTATAAMGPFRYAVIYDNTPATKWLIGWFDYGSSITLNQYETFSVSSAIAGNWNTANPILTIA